MEETAEKPEKLGRLKELFIESRRVLRVTKKPSGPEFSTIVKISGLGIMLIGLIGFIASLIGTLIFS